jgi:hypothetical protein
LGKNRKSTLVLIEGGDWVCSSFPCFVCQFSQNRRARSPRHLPLYPPLISPNLDLANHERSSSSALGWSLLSVQPLTIVGRTALHRTGSIFTLLFHLLIFPHPYHEPKVFQRFSIICLFLGEGGKERSGSHLFYQSTTFLRYHGLLG